MILAVMNAIYAITYIEDWKIQDFNRVYDRDYEISVRRGKKLSYKGTDVGNWSFVICDPLMKIVVWEASFYPW